MNQIAKIHNKIARLDMRQNIGNLESFMLDLPDENKIDCKELITHFFAPGVYVRQMFLPKGMIVTGKIHKTRHVSIISCGHVLISTENGQTEIHGPYTFINEPGDKRAVVVLEDTIWTAIHPTNETDLEKIEDEVIAKDYSESIEESNGRISWSGLL